MERRPIAQVCPKCWRAYSLMIKRCPDCDCLLVLIYGKEDWVKIVPQKIPPHRKK